MARTRNERRRDGQQWILDWLVKTTGRVQNFAYDQRIVPPEVRSYRQIPRVLERYARHAEEMARVAEAAGHGVTAGELYWRAVEVYREAQHSIFEDDNQEKIYLHGKLLECFEGVMRHADHPIARVEIPFEGSHVQGVLHLVPEEVRRGRRLPTVLFCPGMDMTKEAHPEALNHAFVKRGLNCLHIDGPGQGTSNIRKIRVTLDNYERAGSAAIDLLSERPEVDPERIAVSGYSMGSYWGMRIAAHDDRVKAVATAAACYGPKAAIFEQASPRFKQVFMYMTGIHDEDEFDRLAERMVLDDIAPRVTCPTLQVVGEYDPLTHLEDAIEMHEKVAGPRELWVVENDFHAPRGSENFATVDFYGFIADWIADALAGGKLAGLDRTVLVRDRTGLGPYDEPLADVRLPGRIGRDGKGRLTPAQMEPAGV